MRQAEEWALEILPRPVRHNFESEADFAWARRAWIDAALELAGFVERVQKDAIGPGSIAYEWFSPFMEGWS